MFLQQECWTDRVFPLKSHFFKNLKYHAILGPGINYAEYVQQMTSERGQ